MKKIVFVILLTTTVLNVFAQTKTLDVISFAIPKGWQQQQNEGGIQLSISNQSGGYAVAVVTKTRVSSSSANDNFTGDWNTLVKKSVQVNSAPVMQDPVTENGWQVISGGANYSENGGTGMATLLTATAGGNTVSVVLMTNTREYQDQLTGFINSVKLAAPSQNTGAAGGSAGDATANQLLGIWGQYASESYAGAGGTSNLTAGYDWREYYFNADGSYQFLQKNISYLYQNEIVFAYEKGTYTLTGNQLTITPKSGTVESWSKAGSDKAGKLLKTEKRTLEPVMYTINFHYFSGIQKTNLVLQYSKPTVRDGAFSTNGSFPNAWLYARPFTPDKPAIELPAGTKIDFRYKPGGGTVKTTASAAINSPLAGKLWEGTSTEKFSGGTMNGYNTGGFSTLQYKFNADGTYRFASVLASFYTDTKTLGYETGTWVVNDNQLTITPLKGQNEEWSKVGKNSNGNSDVTNRAINETWGKKLKSKARVLQPYTYSFSIGQNGNHTALVLERNTKTEREGEGKISYLNETPAGNAVSLPGGY